MTRFERKFFLGKAYLGHIFTALQEFGYHQTYSERKIISIYYDTDDFLLFRLSEEGVSSRKKIRVRYYNFNIKTAKIENKHKIAESGWKSYLELDVKSNSKNIRLDTSCLSLTESSILIPSNIGIQFKPVLCVSYVRKYLESPFRNNRITLDDQISYSKLSKEGESYKLVPNIFSDHCILEVKYGSDVTPDYSFFNYFSDNYQLVMTRFSKYCEGIRILY